MMKFPSHNGMAYTILYSKKDSMWFPCNPSVSGWESEEKDNNSHQSAWLNAECHY